MRIAAIANPGFFSRTPELNRMSRNKDTMMQKIIGEQAIVEWQFIFLGTGIGNSALAFLFLSKTGSSDNNYEEDPY
jgi:hypothetical protein